MIQNKQYIEQYNNFGTEQFKIRDVNHITEIVLIHLNGKKNTYKVFIKLK